MLMTVLATGITGTGVVTKTPAGQVRTGAVGRRRTRHKARAEAVSDNALSCSGTGKGQTPVSESKLPDSKLPESEPVAEPGSSPTGAPCWVELRTADLPRAKTFYGELCGWHLDDLPVSDGDPGKIADRPGYSVAVKNDVAVAGITTLRPGASVLTTGWATYLAVDDIDEAVSRVGEFGGTVTRKAADAIDTTRIASVLDPTGAPVGLWQANRRVGTTVANMDGMLAWIELLTRRRRRRISFSSACFRADRTGGGTRRPAVGQPACRPRYERRRGRRSRRQALRGDAEPLERLFCVRRHRRHRAARGRAGWVGAVRCCAHADRANGGHHGSGRSTFQSLRFGHDERLTNTVSPRNQPQHRRAVHRCHWYAVRELTAGGLL